MTTATSVTTPIMVASISIMFSTFITAMVSPIVIRPSTVVISVDYISARTASVVSWASYYCSCRTTVIAISYISCTVSIMA